MGCYKFKIMNYILILFPEVQRLMELEWFDDEALLMNDDKHLERMGPSAYFIPIDRWKSISLDHLPSATTDTYTTTDMAPLIKLPIKIKKSPIVRMLPTE